MIETLKIIIVDDQDTGLERIGQRISDFNFEGIGVNIVDRAHTPQEAYPKLLHHKPHLVFMDIDFSSRGLARDEGLTFLKEMNDKRFFDSSFILCTNHADEDWVVDQAARIAKIGILSKVDRKNTFHDKIRDYLIELISFGGNRKLLNAKVQRQFSVFFANSTSKQNEGGFRIIDTYSGNLSEEVFIPTESIFFLRTNKGATDIYTNKQKSPFGTGITLSRVVERLQGPSQVFGKPDGSVYINMKRLDCLEFVKGVPTIGYIAISMRCFGNEILKVCDGKITNPDSLITKFLCQYFPNQL